MRHEIPVDFEENASAVRRPGLDVSVPHHAVADGDDEPGHCSGGNAGVVFDVHLPQHANDAQVTQVVGGLEFVVTYSRILREERVDLVASGIEQLEELLVVLRLTDGTREDGPLVAGRTRDSVWFNWEAVLVHFIAYAQDNSGLILFKKIKRERKKMAGVQLRLLQFI